MSKKNIKIMTILTIMILGLFLTPLSLRALSNLQLLEVADCGIFGSLLKKGGIVNEIFTLIQVLVVVGTIVLGMLDFFNAMSSGEADSMKKASKRFINRIIIAVIIVILPILVDFVVNTFFSDFAKSCITEI